jgi:hypothetical protein
MKTLKTLLFSAALAGLFILSGCPNSSEESDHDKAMKLLTSKTWTLNSVVIPPNTATTEDDWAGFTVSFTSTNMSTNGHPTGASAVWPSGSYTLSEDGKTITRSDQVVMTILTLTETSFNTTFTVPVGTEIGGRIEALDGDYTFNMK